MCQKPRLPTADDDTITNKIRSPYFLVGH
eukprot:COSAG05_NODE_21364_length_272_cov_0.890173_1_plen_28_part_01